MFNILRSLLFFIILFTAGFLNYPLYAKEAKGTLVFDVKHFTSEIKLRKKIRRQLENGAFPWGITNGHLVASLVKRNYIKFDLPYTTRYGEKKILKLKPGTYRISCVGLTYKGGRNVARVLKKGAYFNIDTLRFRIRAGKTTTIEVLPIIQKSKTFLVKVFAPDLRFKIIENGAIKADKFINRRVESSIAWDDYKGPLKFN